MIITRLCLVLFCLTKALSFFPVRQRSTLHSLRSNVVVDDSIDFIKFDLPLAVILAGYSFQAYNDPTSGKVAYGIDGTNITFCSLDYVKKIFAGALLVDLNQGSFVNAKEQQFVERVLTGSNPDPRVVISVVEAPTTAGARARVLDSARSSHRDNTIKPIWNESFYLYVKDPSLATLTFTALDRDLLKEDDLLGVGSMSVADLQALSMTNNGDSKTITSVPVPLYMDNDVAEKSSFLFNFPFQSKNKLKRTGTLQLDVRFVPWANTNKESNTITTSTSVTETGSSTTTTITTTSTTTITTTTTETTTTSLPSISTPLNFALHPEGITEEEARQMELIFRGLPKGASPGLVDWTKLTRSIVYDQTKETVSIQENQPSSTTTSTITTVSSIPKKDKYKHPTHRLSCGLAGSHLAQICSLDCEDTDTQASIWADYRPKRQGGRQIIVSFRGTEQIKYKDILTDISLAQIPFEESNEVLARVFAHQGFLTAYRSVRGAVLQTFHSLLTLDSDDKENEEDDQWDIYVTGHSLGGALATLCAFDIGRMREGLWGLEAPLKSVAVMSPRTNAQSSSSPSSSSPSSPSMSTSSPGSEDGAAVYRTDQRFIDSIKRARLVMYSFGAPRVGDPAFAELFDRLVPDSYRVVNNLDIVARIPRSSKANRLLQYEHIGKTVMVDDKTAVLEVDDISPFAINSMVTTTDTPTSSLKAGASFLGNLAARITSTSASEVIGDVSDELINSLNKDIQQRAIQTQTQLSSKLDAVTGAAASAVNSLQESTLEAATKIATNAVNSVQDAIPMAAVLSSPAREQMEQITKSIGQSVPLFLQNFKKSGVVDAIQSPQQDSAQESSSSSSQLPLLSLPLRQLVEKTMTATGLTDNYLAELLLAGEDMLSNLVTVGNVAADISQGLDVKFIDREKQLLDSILSGNALEHHLEPSYYSALSQALKDSKESDTA